LESVARLQRLIRKGSLPIKQELLSHLAEPGPDRNRRNGDQRRTPEDSPEHVREGRIREGGGGDSIQGPSHAIGAESMKDQPGFVVQIDPRDVLATGSETPAGSEPEGYEKDLQRSAAR